MTTVDERVEAWMSDDLARWKAEQNPAVAYKPRRPLLNEMFDAYVRAADAQTENERAYWVGVGIGYGIAFGFHSREALDNARLVPYSTNLHIDFWKPSSAADTDSYRASGIRYGYLLGTSERADADDCTTCGERITSEDDTDFCEHGEFCATGCIRDWHRGMDTGPCTYWEGVE